MDQTRTDSSTGSRPKTNSGTPSEGIHTQPNTYLWYISPIQIDLIDNWNDVYIPLKSEPEIRDRLKTGSVEQKLKDKI